MAQDGKVGPETDKPPLSETLVNNVIAYVNQGLGNTRIINLSMWKSVLTVAVQAGSRERAEVILGISYRDARQHLDELGFASDDASALVQLKEIVATIINKDSE
ncbi:MAG TPA: hypothetical protein VKK79_08885 [Candidatus Lokiarchaeia archaeon]|nr:hypothetical protein [Candidatus Lokiarchaeia archaeon]